MNLLYTNQDYYTYFLIILLYRKLVAAYNDFGRGFIIKINMKTQILQTHTLYIYIYIYCLFLRIFLHMNKLYCTYNSHVKYL